MMKILAGIVLYNPELKRLMQNINAILPQVDKVICIDNGSKNLKDLKEKLPIKIDVIENVKNEGIAFALNQIAEYAYCYGYDWFLTLDQDSVCMKNLIENYKKYIHISSIGLLACSIKDRNFDDTAKKINTISEVDECITSASLCKTEAIINVGCFDSEMFIDSVDFDICMNLREHGYKICKIGYVGLLHEVGHGKNVSFLWKKRVVYNHSALRNYYMARNRFYMLRKYPKKISMIKTICKEVESEILILLYEKDKSKKIKARHMGVRDAFNNKMGECIWL